MCAPAAFVLSTGVYLRTPPIRNLFDSVMGWLLNDAAGLSIGVFYMLLAYVTGGFASTLPLKDSDVCLPREFVQGLGTTPGRLPPDLQEWIEPDPAEEVGEGELDDPFDGSNGSNSTKEHRTPLQETPLADYVGMLAENTEGSHIDYVIHTISSCLRETYGACR